MFHLPVRAAAAITALVAFWTAPAFAADEAQMMSKCNSYAAHHLHVSTSDITELYFEGRREDGKFIVAGGASNGQAFECIFNTGGTHVVNWTHSAPTDCPADVSEADRYRYPACG